MRNRCLGLVLAALLMPTAVNANDHRADFYFATAAAFASALGGFTFAPAITFTAVHPNLSFIGDLSFLKGEKDDDAAKIVPYSIGLRYMLGAHTNSTNIVSAHFLYGGTYTKTRGVGTKDHAFTVGGAYEYLPHGHETKAAFRVQVDGVISNDNPSYTRISAGLVLRMMGPPKP
jgi:hypothetical protein